MSRKDKSGKAKHMKRYSGITKFRGFLFRYDYRYNEVQLVDKATDKDRKSPFLAVDETGYIVWDTVGLSREHWNDREARGEYLSEWADEIEDETRWEAAV